MKNKVPVTVHFTEKEKKQIRKEAGFIRMSPFIRKTMCEKLGIKLEDET